MPAGLRVSTEWRISAATSACLTSSRNKFKSSSSVRRFADGWNKLQCISRMDCPEPEVLRVAEFKRPQPLSKAGAIIPMRQVKGATDDRRPSQRT